MKKIAVVCEGPTDFHAIESFFGGALRDLGVEVKITSLQPDMDNTRPVGGWINVVSWLVDNPPEVRNSTVFGGGLFSISEASFDALLIQMDTDILNDQGFSDFVLRRFDYKVMPAEQASDRAEQICTVLRKAGRFDEMTAMDIRKHVLSPAVESTENWCVAAFSMPTADFELLSGQALIDSFMRVVHRSEGRDVTIPYSEIDKSVARRKKFCEKHSRFHDRVAEGCTHFRLARDHLVSLIV
jgi:hypothetical protein